MQLVSVQCTAEPEINTRVNNEVCDARNNVDCFVQVIDGSPPLSSRPLQLNSISASVLAVGELCDVTGR